MNIDNININDYRSLLRKTSTDEIIEELEKRIEKLNNL